MAISRQTERKFRGICYYVASWMIASVGLAALQSYSMTGHVDLFSLLFMLQFSLFMGFSHGIYDIVILKDEMDGRSVWTAMFVRSIYFLCAISANLILCILLLRVKEGEGIMNEEGFQSVFDIVKTTGFQVQLAAFFITGYIITFIRSVHKKFGRRVFWNTLMGKTQEPVEEDLVFMFIDLRSSTSICEELGNYKYSCFIKDYYRLLSNCCEENHGEIYQFAGDGVFITWKTNDCQKKARPLDLFFDFKEALFHTRRKFLRKYGVAPDFKAAVHCGKVISTEVGNFGSEMAYHGDVLNTTARIQSLCSKLGQEFLISEELFGKFPLPLPHGFLCSKAGSFELRGKKNAILIFSLQTPLTDYDD
ncbi:MAG: adenylate/guanylate cyclase domain-containing protein [Fibrobacter sp.]|nr:adenylate/guanylate cyclase domain-containing protein [Fibrobacter sp.]